MFKYFEFLIATHSKKTHTHIPQPNGWNDVKSSNETFYEMNSCDDDARRFFTSGFMRWRPCFSPRLTFWNLNLENKRRTQVASIQSKTCLAPWKMSLIQLLLRNTSGRRQRRRWRIKNVLASRARSFMNQRFKCFVDLFVSLEACFLSYASSPVVKRTSSKF